MTIPARRRLRAAWLTVDLVVAVSIIAVAVLPMAFWFAAEARLCRAAYYRAVALEVVDGEAEFLEAGEYKSYGPGVHTYVVSGAAAGQLPGRFELSLTGNVGRLVWEPDGRGQGSSVVREFAIP